MESACPVHATAASPHMPPPMTTAAFVGQSPSTLDIRPTSTDYTPQRGDDAPDDAGAERTPTQLLQYQLLPGSQQQLYPGSQQDGKEEEKWMSSSACMDTPRRSPLLSCSSSSSFTSLSSSPLSAAAVPCSSPRTEEAQYIIVDDTLPPAEVAACQLAALDRDLDACASEVPTTAQSVPPASNFDGGGGGHAGTGAAGPLEGAEFLGGSSEVGAVHAGATTIELDMLLVEPDEFARQITMLDMQIFKAVARSELQNLAWSRRDKFEKAPNVVEFTRRFNHLSFWVTREVLHCVDAHQRSDKLAHFISIAKKLYALNNLHSMMAIVSGLRSAPVYVQMCCCRRRI